VTLQVVQSTKGRQPQPIVAPGGEAVRRADLNLQGAARIKWVFGRIQTVIGLRKIDLRGPTSVG